jgi:multidrug efflux system membrane fusion protein
VNVRALADTRRNALTIPVSALERGPDGLFAYVVQSDSTISVAQLTVGEQNNGVAVIEKGLKDGDRVVTSNQYRLQPGSHVRANGTDSKVATSDANAGAGRAP